MSCMKLDFLSLNGMARSARPLGLALALKHCGEVEHEGSIFQRQVPFIMEHR